MNELTINILIVVAVVAVLTFLAYIGKIDIAKKIVLALVLQAEDKWGSGTGDIKFAEVTGLAYPLLPSIIKMFITEKGLGYLIEEMVTFMKASLMDEQINKKEVL